MKKTQLSLTPIIQFSFLLYKNHFGRLFALGFVVALVDQLIILNIQAPLIMEDQGSWSLNFSSVLLALLSGLWMLLGHLALLTLLYAAHHRQTPSVAGLLTFVGQRLSRVIMPAICFWIVFAAGMALYFLPALLWSTMMAIYLPLALFEKTSGLSALSTSFRWTKPFFLNVLGLMLLVWMLWMLPVLVASALMPSDSAWLVSIDRVADIVLSALTLPLADAFIYSLYAGLKGFYSTKEN